LPQVQRLSADYVLGNKQIKYLQLLGFRFYDRNDKLLLFLPYSERQHVSAVQKLFAQIVFEVFFRHFGGKAYVKYAEIESQRGE